LKQWNMLKPTATTQVPETTARIAKAAFPKGNVYLQIRDELGSIYQDEDFADLYPETGRPALPAWQLALVTVVQFKEGLSDRQAADAVRARIDLKYLLGLDLSDAGFDFSVLSEFRSRLVEGSKELLLLDKLLEQLKAKGLVKARGKVRTDSTHVLMNARVLSRLEHVAETLRKALNDLASLDAGWLQGVVKPDWYERYGKRAEDARFPKGKEARDTLLLQVGADGFTLLDTVQEKNDAELLSVPSVGLLRQVWEHHYRREGGHPKLKEGADQGPLNERFNSSYDPEARHGNKGTKQWEGYKLHITESCDETLPHVITHVMTTSADVMDLEMTLKVHTALAEKDLLPSEHLVDSGYTRASYFIASEQVGIDLIGPVRAPANWQAKTEGAFDVSLFEIDWEKQQVTCPQGKMSSSWTPTKDAYGNKTVSVNFRHHDCMRCEVRSHCTRRANGRRQLVLRPREEHETLQQARVKQQTDAWQLKYNQRAGIEGTFSQGVRTQGLRRSRYRGLAKTSLQHSATASATSLQRLHDFWCGMTPAQTRISPFKRLAA
jgi:transposase